MLGGIKNIHCRRISSSMLCQLCISRHWRLQIMTLAPDLAFAFLWGRMSVSGSADTAEQRGKREERSGNTLYRWLTPTIHPHTHCYVFAATLHLFVLFDQKNSQSLCCQSAHSSPPLPPHLCLLFRRVVGWTKHPFCQGFHFLPKVNKLQWKIVFFKWEKHRPCTSQAKGMLIKKIKKIYEYRNIINADASI